jgi:hypothetical protein
VVPVCRPSPRARGIDQNRKRPSPRSARASQRTLLSPSSSTATTRTSCRLGSCRKPAEIHTSGTERQHAQSLLRARYPQLERMDIARCPVIAVIIERTTSWGNLSIAEGG